MIDELIRPAQNPFVATGSIAMIYAGLKDKDKAFEFLNKAVREDHAGAIINVDAPFETLRSDPRYKELRKSMNLPE
jgi:hypothetical protein